MPDTGTQIRDYYDEIVIRVGVNEILEPAHPITPVAPRRFPGALVAGLAAAAVLLIVGSLGLWLAIPQSSTEPDSSSTTVPPEPPTLPDLGLEDVPGFEAVVRYDLGGRDGTPEGSTVDVLFSYEPPSSYRREILRLDPPEMEFWRGEVGDSVASDGTFRIVTGETTEEGQVLGALVWFNWEHRCAAPPVPVETKTAARTLTTVTCGDPDDPWTIVVDRDSGVVVQASGELHGDDFTIPGIGLEVLSVTYDPDYGTGSFAAPENEPPAIPGEPVVFTYTETQINFEAPDGTPTVDSRSFVVQVTWLDHGTWRADVISGNFGSLLPSSFQIYADQTLFTYSADSNEYNEERFPSMDGRRNLVANNDCDPTGTCINDGIRLACETTPGEVITGRPVTRYECAWPAPYSPETMWIDDELGYVLKSESVGERFEVTAIDLDPVIDPAIFEQVCPTSDCTLVDSS